MGNGISNKASTNTATSNTIRVVHLSGSVEFIEAPASVGQLLDGGTKPPLAKHFLCTPAQLLSGSMEPLRPQVQLEPGHVYFLLPFSAFSYEVSRLDLAALAKRLSASAARACRSKAKGVPSRLIDRPPEKQGQGEQSWKPVLETIVESALNSISELDPREKHHV